MTAFALLAAAAVAAQAPPPTPPKPKPADLICHAEPDPGSRFTHRVCVTRQELQNRRAMTRQYLDEIHQQGQFAPMQPMMMGPSH